MRYNLCGINGKFSHDNARAEALSPHGDKVLVPPEYPTWRSPGSDSGDSRPGRSSATSCMNEKLTQTVDLGPAPLIRAGENPGSEVVFLEDS